MHVVHAKLLCILLRAAAVCESMQALDSVVGEAAREASCPCQGAGASSEAREAHPGGCYVHAASSDFNFASPRQWEASLLLYKPVLG